MRNSFLVACATSAFQVNAIAQPYGGPAMMWTEGWGMYGLVHMLFWLLVVFGIIYFVRRGHHAHRRCAPEEDRALSILRERYARGEIDKAEFETRKGDLMHN